MVGVDDFDGPGRPALDVASDTRRIVEALSPRKVVVQSVLLTSYPGLNGSVTDLNNRNRAYCATGACQYLELNDLFSRGGLLRTDMGTGDGIHIAGKAYPLWAARVEALVDPRPRRRLSINADHRLADFDEKTPAGADRACIQHMLDMAHDFAHAARCAKAYEV
jgi:hypothetical protein